MCDCRSKVLRRTKQKTRQLYLYLKPRMNLMFVNDGESLLTSDLLTNSCSSCSSWKRTNYIHQSRNWHPDTCDWIQQHDGLLISQHKTNINTLLSTQIQLIVNLLHSGATQSKEALKSSPLEEVGKHLKYLLMLLQTKSLLISRCRDKTSGGSVATNYGWTTMLWLFWQISWHESQFQWELLPHIWRHDLSAGASL